MSPEGDQARVDVVYATADEQRIVAVELPPGATLRDAIALSGLPAEFPEIDLDSQAVGVHARLRDIDGPACDGDRIEIYRPLTADPNQRRRERAA